jgi:5-oxoprolinase (ATP-hydrolysing)
VVEPGWQAQLTALDHLVLQRACPRRAPRGGTDADPVLLEVFNNLFMNIAEQMGLQLQNTAYSVNIKERLDFSCALFDAEGQLIANAPHMPVHLGSMGESIKTVIREQPGTCSPATSTCSTTPTTAARTCPTSPSSRRCTWTATPPTSTSGSRGHHADIGGTTPGSMPPFSRASRRRACRSTTSSW